MAYGGYLHCVSIFNMLSFTVIPPHCCPEAEYGHQSDLCLISEFYHFKHGFFVFVGSQSSRGVVWSVWQAWLILKTINILVVGHSAECLMAILNNVNVPFNASARYPNVLRIVPRAAVAYCFLWPPRMYQHFIYLDTAFSDPANSL